MKRRPNKFKEMGEYLGVSFAASNPRKAIKKAKRPLGNLPLEIMGYLASFIDEIIDNGQLPIPMQQTLACECFSPNPYGPPLPLSLHPSFPFPWRRQVVEREGKERFDGSEPHKPAVKDANAHCHAQTIIWPR